ncbi:NAD(P)-binding domain-containing protein [Chitinophaga niabensis]|uniref:NADPH-dependent F420 reductase n=1 Tax=Chitinophaga niabensis TaxID=536979 RepID=UPI0031BBCBE7
MNIAIIGSGEMGGCLAAMLIKLGHTVSVANSRGPAIEEVVENKEVIIVSIPQKNIPTLSKRFPKDAVVIDTGNYYPNLRDGNIPALDQSGIDSLWVQEQLGVPVVKVFNSILATSLKDKSTHKRIALAVSGDDAKAKEVVFKMVEDLGFDHFDIGTIAQSWKQQPGSVIYCRDINLEELKRRVDTMGNDMQAVITKRKADEVLMKNDYPAYLEYLQRGLQ